MIRESRPLLSAIAPVSSTVSPKSLSQYGMPVHVAVSCPVCSRGLQDSPLMP